MSIENSEGFILSIKERELAKKPHDSLKLPRKVTTHGPEKKFVSLDTPTDDPDLDDAYSHVILNNDKEFFSDDIDIFDFLNIVVDRVCREAKTRNLKMANKSEKELIKTKLERSQKILEVLEKKVEEKEKKIDSGFYFSGLVRQQTNLVNEQLEKYK